MWYKSLGKTVFCLTEGQTDGQTDRQTDGRTAFSWLDRDTCNACNAVIKRTLLGTGEVVRITVRSQCVGIVSQTASSTSVVHIVRRSAPKQITDSSDLCEAFIPWRFSAFVLSGSVFLPCRKCPEVSFTAFFLPNWISNHIMCFKNEFAIPAQPHNRVT